MEAIRLAKLVCYLLDPKMTPILADTGITRENRLDTFFVMLEKVLKTEEMDSPMVIEMGNAFIAYLQHLSDCHSFCYGSHEVAILRRRQMVDKIVANLKRLELVERYHREVNSAGGNPVLRMVDSVLMSEEFG